MVFGSKGCAPGTPATPPGGYKEQIITAY